MLRKKQLMHLVITISILLLTLVSINGCKTSLSEGDLIVVQLAQSRWSLDYVNSSGTIEVVLQGAGVQNIILDSIQMRGDNASAGLLKATSAYLEGDHVVALFAKNRVLLLLLTPSSGTTHTVYVTFQKTDSANPVEVSTVVTVTDEPDDSEPSDLELEIDPNDWNLNFSKSSGTVEAFIEGEGIDKIDLNSIQMHGDNPSAGPLTVDSVSLKSDRIHARFPKSQVIDLLLNPEEGSTHTITVSFLVEGSSERMELSDEISIEEDDDTIAPSDLELEIEPDEWDLNFSESSGTVEAFIEGEGIDKIDLNSIQMYGDNPSAGPLAVDSASLSGDHIHARFPKNQVIDLLLNPGEGSTHTITVSFLVEGSSERMELSDEISIEEDDDTIEPSDLELEIEPDEWNLNFSKSSGTVEVFIEGEGIDKIDLNSIQMLGDNPSAGPLAAGSASLSGDHIHARFPKNQVIDLLLNPEEDSTHIITVSFLVEGSSERMELSDEISIEEDDDTIEPSELELEIKPDEWNLNFSKSSGTVEAFIEGEGIDKIDLDSFQMHGDNPSAGPLAADSASLSGDHIHARFPKNRVIDLLLNPQEDSTHIITVSFLVEGSSERMELNAEIKIEDEDDDD